MSLEGKNATIPEHFNTTLLKKYDTYELEAMLIELLRKHTIHLGGSLYDTIRGKSPSNPQAVHECMLVIQEICVRHYQDQER
jgi:hypothetical protein